MPSARRRFRLVVYEHHLDPHIFREILADALDLHRTDAMRLVSHVPGVIPFQLTHAKARRVGKVLASVGVEIGVWRADRLPDLSQPALVHKVDCRADGLETFGVRGEPLHWMPWAQLELISVGETPGATKELTLRGPTWLTASVGAVRAMVLGYHRVGVTVRKIVAAPKHELWIVRRRPTQVIRVQQDSTNYEYLGARRAPSARANFRRLVEDLIRLAPHATVTPATHLQASFRDCTRCHVAIHGSNVDPRFLEQ